MTSRLTIADRGLLSISGFCVVVMFGCREPDRAPDEATARPPSGKLVEAPIAELSGLVYHRGADGNALLAVGDSDSVLIRLPAGVRLNKSGFQRIALPRVSQPASQFEGVASDGGNHVYILEESPGTIYAYDLSTDVPRYVTRFPLVIADDHPLAASWRDAENARGEGLVFLGPGRFLVAKQRKPRALIEFGPKGAAPMGVLGQKMSRPVDPALSSGDIVPLAYWKPDDDAKDLLDDLSELSWGPGGGLFVLSSRSRRIAQLSLPLDPAAKGAGRFKVQRHWDIDASSVGLDCDAFKPEGLAFDASGQVLVGLDRKAGKPNLLVMPPLK